MIRKLMTNFTGFPSPVLYNPFPCHVYVTTVYTNSFQTILLEFTSSKLDDRHPTRTWVSKLSKKSGGTLAFLVGTVRMMVAHGSLH